MQNDCNAVGVAQYTDVTVRYGGTSVRGSRFDTISVQQGNKKLKSNVTMLGFF